MRFDYQTEWILANGQISSEQSPKRSVLIQLSRMEPKRGAPTGQLISIQKLGETAWTTRKLVKIIKVYQGDQCCHICHMEVSTNGGSTKWLVFVRESPMKMDDFRGTPISVSMSYVVHQF